MNKQELLKQALVNGMKSMGFEYVDAHKSCDHSGHTSYVFNIDIPTLEKLIWFVENTCSEGEMYDTLLQRLINFRDACKYRYEMGKLCVNFNTYKFYLRVTETEYEWLMNQSMVVECAEDVFAEDEEYPF